MRREFGNADVSRQPMACKVVREGWESWVRRRAAKKRRECARKKATEGNLCADNWEYLPPLRLTNLTSATATNTRLVSSTRRANIARRCTSEVCVLYIRFRLKLPLMLTWFVSLAGCVKRQLRNDLVACAQITTPREHYYFIHYFFSASFFVPFLVRALLLLLLLLLLLPAPYTYQVTLHAMPVHFSVLDFLCVLSLFFSLDFAAVFTSAWTRIYSFKSLHYSPLYKRDVSVFYAAQFPAVYFSYIGLLAFTNYIRNEKIF